MNIEIYLYKLKNIFKLTIHVIENIFLIKINFNILSILINILIINFINIFSSN